MHFITPFQQFLDVCMCVASLWAEIELVNQSHSFWNEICKCVSTCVKCYSADTGTFVVVRNFIKICSKLALSLIHSVPTPCLSYSKSHAVGPCAECWNLTASKKQKYTRLLGSFKWLSVFFLVLVVSCNRALSNNTENMHNTPTPTHRHTNGWWG